MVTMCQQLYTNMNNLGDEKAGIIRLKFGLSTCTRNREIAKALLVHVFSRTI